MDDNCTDRNLGVIISVVFISRYLMVNLMRLIVMLTLSLQAMAESRTVLHGLPVVEDRKSSPLDKFVASSRTPVIKQNKVASLVRKQHGNSRILNIVLTERAGLPVYKVKTLSNDGVLKHVYVDGRSGEVFD